MKARVLVGTRKSQLAIRQAEIVIKRLSQQFPKTKFVMVPITTQGDKIKTADKIRKAQKGVFVKEIENKLLKRKIDIAVHSLKDVPTEMIKGLKIGAYLPRESAHDVLISKNNLPFDRISEGSTIGTSSMRRQAFLKSSFHRLVFKDIRGNLNTRIEKLCSSSSMAGIVVSEAGVSRLYPHGLSMNAQRISFDILPPSPGQGVIAVEIREKDTDLFEELSFLNDPSTENCVLAERAFLERLEGGCNMPIGAIATIEMGLVRLQGAIASINGSRVVKDEAIGSPDDPKGIAQALAAKMKDKGADGIIRDIRGLMPKELYFLTPPKSKKR